ncbi:MAG TPA: hypothetical protein PLN69_08125 [bacterium]|nr:hypothetical protein [bacterium]
MKRFIGIEKKASADNSEIEFSVVMAEPSLSDNRSDLDRLSAAIRAERGMDVKTVSPDVLRSVPFVLRKSGWRVVCSVQAGENGGMYLAAVKGTNRA